VTVPRDAVNGTVILSSAVVAPPFQVSVNCTSGEAYGIVNNLGRQPDSGVRTFPIGTTGLAFRWTYSDAPSGFASPLSGPNTLTGTVGFSGTTHGFQLVKIGAIAIGSQVPAGSAGSWNFGGLTALRMKLSNAIQVTPQTCSVLTPSVTVPLTRPEGLPKTVFTGVGSSSQAVSFSLKVDCTGVAAKVAATFTDSRDPTNTGNTLPLTAGSTATGVGVQILRNNTPVNFGPDSSAAGNTNQIQLFVADGTSNITTIQLGARYIQTAAAVTPGIANSIATFTFSYQ
jgi:type 1 fimbria pilin